MKFIKCKGDIYLNMDHIQMLEVLRNVSGDFCVIAYPQNGTQIVVADGFPDKQYANNHVLGIIT